MPRIVFRAVKQPKSGKEVVVRINSEVGRRVKATANKYANQYQTKVAGWRNLPKIVGRVSVTANSVTASVLVTNNAARIKGNSKLTIGRLLTLQDEIGAGSRTIVPRRASVLAFDVNGNIRFAKVVAWPGFRPKGWTAEISPMFNRDIDLDIKSGMKGALG